MSIKVAEHIYFRSEKILNQYQVLINRKGAFFSRVYPSLEEAVKGRNDFLSSLENGSLNTTIVNRTDGVD